MPLETGRHNIQMQIMQISQYCCLNAGVLLEDAKGKGEEDMRTLHSLQQSFAHRGQNISMRFSVTKRLSYSVTVLSGRE